MDPVLLENLACHRLQMFWTAFDYAATLSFDAVGEVVGRASACKKYVVVFRLG